MFVHIDLTPRKREKMRRKKQRQCFLSFYISREGDNPFTIACRFSISRVAEHRKVGDARLSIAWFNRR